MFCGEGFGRLNRRSRELEIVPNRRLALCAHFDGLLYPLPMRWVLSMLLLAVMAGCGPAAQPASARTVAAYEIPLTSEADRIEFLSVLRTAAQAYGMHVDATSEVELEREAKVIPIARRTLSAAVWRGSNDEEAVASAMDLADHLGRVWLMFSQGEDPDLATRFRERALQDIRLHWPQTLPLPIMPNGGIPLARDLIRTPGGYQVKPSEAHRYERAIGDPNRSH